MDLLSKQIWENSGESNWVLRSVLRGIRRGLDEIISDYNESRDNHMRASGKPSVMQVKVEQFLFQFYSQAKHRGFKPVAAQFPTVNNVTARIRFVQDEQGSWKGQKARNGRSEFATSLVGMCTVVICVSR